MNNLSKQEVQQLYDTGGFLLFLDFPEGSEFGIDFKQWTVGPKFKGLKMIPPGVHFVFFNVCTKPGLGDYAPRMGFFVDIKPNEIIIKKWDKLTEDMSLGVISEEEQAAYRAGLREMDGCLGAYPMEQYRQWYSLSNHINGDLLQRLHPLNGRISTQCELITKEQSEGGVDSQRVDREHRQRVRYSDAQGLPIMHVKPDAEIRFTPICSRVPVGCVGADITRHSMDTSNQLDRFLSTAMYASYQLGILGELQFAFLCFVLGHVYAGFEQWKCMLGMLCTCDHALVTRPGLFAALLPVLHFQLMQCPKDFFVDIISKDNFLTATLGNLFANFDANDGVSAETKQKAAKFRQYLERHFKWSFDDVE